MCGIVGMFKKEALLNDNEKEGVRHAANRLIHRGPDFQGIWTSDNVIMSHNKLSIQNFSSKSNQPVYNSDFALAFNGEIYNWRKLVSKFNLKNCNYDGDVIFQLYSRIGIKMVEELEGEFAIVLFNKKTEKLYLIRDRLGIKPLVYYIDNQRVYFSSEAKVFNECVGISLKPNFKRILADLACWFWVDKNETYFEGIYNVKPGEIIEVDVHGLVKTYTYWDLEQNKLKNIDEESIRNLLKKSILDRQQGEAKVATLLSGGLDSSLISSIVSEQVETLTSYTVKYDNFHNNSDLMYAKELAKQNKNINHTINHVKREEINKVTLKKLSFSMEEVIWDKVYFAMYKNYSQANKDGFRVILNGQGADETWLGYYHDFPMYHFNLHDFNFEKIKLELLKINDLKSSYFTPKAHQLIDKMLKQTLNLDFPKKAQNPLEIMQYWATKTYLLSNLMQEDRLSMANSVECRTPFLNHKLVEAAFNYPTELKVINGNEKAPLKDIGKSYLPESIVCRQKQAFVNPEGEYNTEIINLGFRDLPNVLKFSFLNNFFTHKLVEDIEKKNISSDLLWKLEAINIFLSMFNKEGKFSDNE